MKKQFISVVLPGIFLLSSAEAAKFIPIDESNFMQYIHQSGKILNTTNSNGKFVLDKTITLPNGLVKKKYVQFYHEVPVFASSISSSEVSGVQQDWWGKMLSDISTDLPDTQPNFSAQEAIDKSKHLLGIPKAAPTQLENATLYVMANRETQVAQLVYLVSFYIDTDTPKRPFVIINAKDGQLIDKWDGLTTKDGSGPGGNQKIGQYTYGKDYGPLWLNDSCQMSNTNVDTYNLNGQTSGGSIFKFSSCPTDSVPVNTVKQINGAYSPLNDAHFFGGVVYDMYEKWYKMNPLGDGSKLKIRVHYGRNYENAFWDGEQMTFGDGGSSLYPLTSLDVMGHEVSHGVTEKNSGLVYQYQSGGMNEAFSDMAGETAEYYMQSQVGLENDWLIGASIMKNSTAMRYFKNPSKDGQSIENASDYNDSLDVHFTSGVYNKAFYTLASKSSWGIRKAFEVFLTANRVYWANNETFDGGACGVAKAARDLGYEVSDVVSSFKVVGVNGNCLVPDPDPNPDPNPNPGPETEIKNGQTVSNIQLGANQERRYFIQVPSLNRYPYTYKYLYFALSNGATAKDVAELYVRYDNAALTNQQPAPKLVSAGQGKDEVFYIQYPYAGTYHILVKGKAAAKLNLLAFYGN